MPTVASWNINSLRARLPLVLRYLDEVAPDVLCLQETRVTESGFPRAPFEDRGWHVQTTSSGGYAGVAILSRLAAEEVVSGLPGFVEDRAPGRRLAVRVAGIWFDTVYVPTRMKIGKVEFLDALRADQLARWGEPVRLVLTGDFNICFDERDYASPSMITDADQHPSRPEDLAFRRLLEGRLYDCFRQVESGKGHFSWYPPAPCSVKRNYGMRLDYVFASKPLVARVVAAKHDLATRQWPRPSDHLPVHVTFQDQL